MEAMAPPLPADRAAADRAIWQAFRHHSRTFSFAARLLPGRVQLPIATIYLFCRTIDTLADERVLDVGPAAALEELAAARAALKQTFAGLPPAEPLWQRLHEVHQQYQLDPAPFFELLAGAQWDLEGQTVQTEADLIHYANLVGGCVGAMMLPFLVAEAQHRAPLEKPARDLGIAMQITNIVRDVGEDRRRLDRVYVPSAWLADHGLARTQLDAPPIAQSYPGLLEQMMRCAEAYYDASLAGIEALPTQARLGIYSAARIYRDILNQVRANRYDNLSQRAFVPLRRKLRLVLHDDYAQRRARLRPARLTA